ncbi:hypothetical protein ANSO36C_43520 [Nostoc cf. commune SO-36]|uniref:YrdC-like domain-containing protein n=1 Tax=Nostoc cf. commune SO-36 TaxID=449208 RepID=A0ABM7Z633_NOSCO|nr:hypothetical protein ANSO36C_43520 [Nostoc cf. commune SO-36]
MAKIFPVHPDNPQIRRIEEIKSALSSGAVMLYPTDTVYAIGCDLNAKSAVERVRQIKQLANDKPLTFLCPSLSNVATYAFVSDTAYRIMKRLIPGPYTFLLPATKLVTAIGAKPQAEKHWNQEYQTILCAWNCWQRWVIRIFQLRHICHQMKQMMAEFG